MDNKMQREKIKKMLSLHERFLIFSKFFVLDFEE